MSFEMLKLPPPARGPGRLIFALLSFLIIPLVLSGCEKSTRPPLSTAAYVWQSADKPAVREAMEQANDAISTFHARTAELRWTGDRFAIRRFTHTLPSPGCGLVVRIGASAASLDWTPAQIEPVAKLFREIAALGPSEIQCDYDCPQKRLDSYHRLLTALQSAAGKVPVIPTALPSWLDEPGFRSLITGRHGYVLQVHSLQLPQRRTDPAVIFDPAAAGVALKKAAALGEPFRVAMATYGCEIRFGADGKVVDVISEDIGASTAPIPGRAFAMADPAESAHFVRRWTDRRPANLTGFIWYRLPVEGDRRNWPWITFQKVILGEVSVSKPELEAAPGPGARDLFVSNHGPFPIELPSEIVVTTPVVAADGAGAYRLQQQQDGLHFRLNPQVWPWLDPGKKIAAGWLRTREETPRIESHFSP